MADDDSFWMFFFENHELLVECVLFCRDIVNGKMWFHSVVWDNDDAICSFPRFCVIRRNSSLVLLPAIALGVPVV